jgi:serine/threonine protein kinase
MVNRPSYQPLDSDVIRQELENLEQFKSIAGIVQPAGAAVLPNPYMTDPQSSDPQIVISGILLEYYSGGTLQHVLKERRVREFCWEQWAVQIGNALDTIHWEKKTLMDLKPSNVVLDEQGNAVLIDISGIGGVTYEWRAPEIQDEISPFDLPFQARRWNDVWAYGAIIKQLASQVEDCPFGRTLKMVADHLTKDIHTKWTLSEAISQLEASVS